MDAAIGEWIRIVVMRTLREKNLLRLDVSTLLSAGMLGYVQARMRYDATRGVKFKTFAEYRIKGEVLDEVRRMIGDERCKTKRPRKVEFDYTLISDGGNFQRYVESKIDMENIIKKIDLDKREEDILELRMSGMSLREISSNFAISESRTSQLLASIKEKLYRYYKDDLVVEASVESSDSGRYKVGGKDES